MAFLEAEKRAFPKGGRSQQVSSDTEVKKNDCKLGISFGDTWEISDIGERGNE